jgi:hypothetical protein
VEERLERALTARFHDDLLPAVADLPDEGVQPTFTGGRIRRAGDWQVPRLLRIESEHSKLSAPRQLGGAFCSPGGVLTRSCLVLSRG